jgi:hypothetical protein
MRELRELLIFTHEQRDELIRELYRRLVELEARVLKNNHNTSKPLSSNGLSRNAFCVTRSYLVSMRKQGRDLFHCLILTFYGQPPQSVLSG